MSKSSLKKQKARATARGQLSLMAAKAYAKGGEVSAEDEDDEDGVGDVGSAQKLLSELTGDEPASEKKKTQSASLKRLATSGGGMAMPKVMDMSPESLASTRELVAMAQDKGTAKEQMAELARLYQLRAATFSQPTLSEQTFNKNTLAARRFAEGGEAKKGKALPTVMEVRDYATEASERLFPDQGGQDDQRDAARHMLAGAALARRYGPNVAKLLGLAHEYSSNPQTFFSGLGIGQPRDDFEYDEHNNRIGMGLASQATSREELEALVKQMAAKSSTEKREDRPWIMSQEKMDARAAKAAKGPAPRPQGYQKGGIVKALKGTKAVDEAGKPVTTYRGEYGASDMPSTQLGSYTFGSKDAANLYASSPNDSRNAVEAMKVFPAQLSIRKPLVNTPDDPFVDLKFLRKALGQKEFKRVVNKNADRIENTGAFEELADAKGYDSLQDLLEKNPKDLDQLYTEIFPILDDPKTVKTLQRRGYDGAIYGGSGATALEPEYRVFSTSQAISPFGNKPMSPRSARQQLGDLAQSMEVSPTDALGFFGRVAGVAASALTPSSLNKGEDEELRRRQSQPATIDKPVSRAKGSPEEGEMTDPEAALFEGREDVPAPARNKVLDEILGAGETALTLGTGAAASLAGMPYGLYKGLTSGKYLEGKAADIAGKEAAAFMERNTYLPRTESGRENLAAIAKIADQMKLAPAPGGAAIASIPRTAALAQAERLGMAAEKALEGPVTRTMERGGKAADLLGSFAAEPSRAVRPTGSTMLTGPLGFTKDVSAVDQLLLKGKSNARSVAGQDSKREELISDFWDKKARNYFTRQFGTPDDPIADAIAKKRIRGVGLEEMFPEYMIDQIGVGTTRTNAEGQTRFFPKYPRAMDDFTGRYDKATGLRGNVVSTDPAMGRADSEYSMSRAADDLRELAKDRESDRMLAQGMRPEMINLDVTPLVQSGMNPERVLGGTSSASDKLFRAYQEAEQYAKMTPEQQREWANTQFGNGRPLQGLDQERVAENILPTNVMTAIQKGEPVYDIGYMDTPLRKLFEPSSINEYLATLPERQISTIRFEDAVRGAIKLRESDAERQVLVDRIKAGKPVADKVFSEGVSKPLVQIKEGPLEGFAWKRIEKREATVPEGAYVGHSVGGYETGGATYTADKREGFKTGKWQVYTLRDNRNRPVNTIEVRMDDENTPVVTQIKGNGRATGNTAPEKYDTAVLEFLEKHLKPARIEENDRYLTPRLQSYKRNMGDLAAQEKERALYRELGLE